MIWIRNISIALVLLVLLGSCEKRFNNPLAEKFVIEGRLYEGYNFVPVSDYPLKLMYNEIDMRNAYIGQKKVLRRKTDGDGYFRFEYSKFGDSKLGYLYIQDDLEKESNPPDRKILLKRIELNTDLERDICVSRIGQIEFFINYSTLETDSFLFRGSSGRLFRSLSNIDFEFNETEADDFPSHRGILLKPEMNQVNFTAITSWDGYTSNNDLAVLTYGLGREDYFLSANATRIDSINFDYNKVRFRISGFPNIDTVVINLD